MRRRALLAAGVLGVLAAGAALLLLRRPPAPRPERPASAPGAPVEEVVRASRAGRRVLFVGWDGADWQLLDRLLAEGAMPNLAALVKEGASGVLETIHPPLSPLVWTTMMTGASPVKHGILDFTRFHPVTGRKEPISADERRLPAAWNMASYGGRTSAVFGMWATYPAESVDGLVVSDRLFSFLYEEESPPPGTVWPPAREAWARQALQEARAAVGYDQVKEYLPWLARSEYDARADAKDPYAHPVSALRRILVETRVYHHMAKEWLARERPGLTVVYVQGTDTVGHVFAPYVPPRLPSVSAEDVALYGHVPARYYAAADAQLGDYARWARANDAALVLASDHGFLWGEGRPTELSSFAHATAGKWHRNDGVYVVWNAGVPATSGHAARGSARQVCATLLALLGLPAPREVESQTLAGVPANPATANYALFYRPPAPVAAPAAGGTDEEAIAKLKALGYVGAAETSVRGPGAGTRTAGSFNNEGLVLKAQGDLAGARAAFERAVREDPALPSALWNLSDLLFTEGKDLDEADALLLRAFAAGSVEAKRHLITRAIAYQRSDRLPRTMRLLDGAVAAQPDEPEVRLFRGRFRVEAGDCRGALDDFVAALAREPRNPAAHASAGLARLCLGDRTGAREALLQSLRLDPDQPKVKAALAGL